MNPIQETEINCFEDAEVLDNFRIGPDGGLTKREGYSFAAYLDGKVRGTLNDAETTYLVAGYSFYTFSDGELSYIGYLSSCSFDDENEEVFLFIAARSVYIMGGGSFYRYDPDTGYFGEEIGYCPLIRRNSQNLGHTFDPFEPMNIGSYGLRIHYNTNTSSSRYNLFGSAVKVNGVWLDGELQTKGVYTTVINGTSSYVSMNVNYLRDTTDVVIEYELDPNVHPQMRRQLFKCTKAAVYEHEGELRMLIYGGELKDRIYVSDYAHFDPVECARELYTTTNARDEQIKTIYDKELKYKRNTFNYFIEVGSTAVGFNGDTVRSIARIQDKYMVFTGSGSYHAEYVDEIVDENGYKTSGIKTCLITDEYGICKNSGTAVFEDSIYFFSDNGLYRYSYNSMTYDFIATHIDIPEYASPPREAYGRIRLFLYRRYGELWCLYDGYATVFNIRKKLWYRFSGINADKLFCHDGGAGLSKDYTLYIFDENSYTDAGVGFEAVYRSKSYDLGNVFAKKTVYGLGAAFDSLSGARIDCTLVGDTGISRTYSLTPVFNGGVSPAVVRKHVRLDGVRHIKLVIVSPADRAPGNLKSIMIRYRELGGRI